jgi:hypothetical protein
MIHGCVMTLCHDSICQACCIAIPFCHYKPLVCVLLLAPGFPGRLL